VRTRRWLAALTALLGCSAPAQSHAAPADARKAEAILVGSSSFNQSFGHLIEQELERRGYRVTRKAVDGAGLARPDFHDMNQELDALPVGHETAAVFVYLGVNDAQDVWLYPHERGSTGHASVAFGSADWDGVYGRRTRDFLERVQAKAVGVTALKEVPNVLSHHLPVKESASGKLRIDDSGS